MRSPRSFMMIILACAVIVLTAVPLSVTGQWHSGHKGRYFSGGVNMLVNTFPASPVTMIIARADGLPVTPEVNPALELEFAVLKRIGLGLHASRRTLGVPYNHDITWTFRPNPAADLITEPVPAGAFPYKWNRIGVDLLFYSRGFQAPYGRYIKLSLSRTSLTLENPQQYLAPFQRDIDLKENITFLMPSIGFGRKFLVHDRAWVGIGGQYTPDLQRINYFIYDRLIEMDLSNNDKEVLYDNTDLVEWARWSTGVSSDPDNFLDMRILVHQILRLSLTMSVGIIF